MSSSFECCNIHKHWQDWYLLKRGTTWNDLKRPETTWNDLQQARNDLKQPTTTYTQQETTWNNLQRARNDLKPPKTSKAQPTMTWTYLQRAKKRSEMNNNKQILRLFYNMGETVLFSNTFSTQHLVAVIQALLHGESWWKPSVKHLLSSVKPQLSCVFFTRWKIYFFLSGFCVTTSTRYANRSVFRVCIYRRSLMMNKDFASGSRNGTTIFYYQNLYKSK